MSSAPLDAEAQSMIQWLERRLEYATRSTFPIYIGMFRSMWGEHFGNEDNLPPEYKESVMSRYKKLQDEATTP